MQIPRPSQAVVALAAFVRDRLVEASETLAPLWHRRETERGLAVADGAVAAARQLATVISGAAAPFAPTPYSRARLIRQMHATGLLTDDEVRRTVSVLDTADDVRRPRPVRDVYAAPR